MTPWFSLILPCYNVGKYVERCVKSIIAQDYSDYEIILVDDGSTDHTLPCCNELAEKHSCIRVIHKENGGLSSARNAGLDAAQGKYVWFIDSDDWIEPGALAELYQACCDGEPEIVKFAYYRMVNTKTPEPLNVEEGIYRGDQQLDQLRQQAFSAAGQYCLSAWSHIYLSSFLKQYQMQFVSERMICSEDYLFNLQTLLHVRCLRVISSYLYVYEMRAGSLTQTYKPDLMGKYGELYQRLLQSYRNAGVATKYERLINRFYVWHLTVGTAMLQEYGRLTDCKSPRQVRRAVHDILSRPDVQAAVKNGDQTGMTWQKKVQCFAIRIRFEGLFFWLYAVKPGLIHNGKRLERE